MQVTQNQKVVVVTPPAAILDNGSAVTNVIDTRGFGYCDIIAVVGATDIAMTALKVQESTQSGAGFADVPETVFGGAGKPALPVATDDNKAFHIGLDLRKRERFLDVVATLGDGAAGGYISIIAVLSRPVRSCDSASDRGFAGEILA